MPELLLKGHPLNSAAAIREVIADMKATRAAKDMRLDMFVWASSGRQGVCTACAGGSAVIHGLGGSRDAELWTNDEWKVAGFYNKLRAGEFRTCELRGYPIAATAQSAYCDAMSDHSDPDFFPAWERFADAVETAEKVGA